MFRSFFAEKKDSINKKSYIWNMIAGLVNAAEAVIMMAVVSRVINDNAVGVLTISFAVGNLLMNVGKFGVRNFQVTDFNKFKLSDFYSLRLITTAVMLICTLGFVGFKSFLGGYDVEKSVTVLTICLIYCIEAYEDLFLGNYQAVGRLDIASKVFVIRWAGILISFIVCVAISHSLPVSIIIALIVSIILEIILLKDANIVVNVGKYSFESGSIKTLIIQCFPLFAFLFLTFYVTNAPKYSIDSVLSDNEQAVFGILAMPVFLIELLNNFIYQPQMVDLTKEWHSSDLRLFFKRILKQVICIVLITAFCSAGSYLIGNRLLTVIFSVDVDSYRNELLVLMISGGVMAIMGYSSVIITVMRKQIVLLFGMLFVSLLAFFGFDHIVLNYGIMGASYYYLLLFGLASIYNVICIVIFACKKPLKEQHENKDN